MIDPDGQGGQPPVSVECDMADPPVTIIHHDREDITTNNGLGWSYPGELAIPVKYTNSTIQQIRAVVLTSDTCTYHVKIEHRNALITGFSFWKSFEGEQLDWDESTDTVCQGRSNMLHLLQLQKGENGRWELGALGMGFGRQ